MTVARSQLVDVNVSRWYHTIARCARRARLFGEGEATGQGGDRKAWIERRLQELDNIFAVSTGGFAVLDNHLHLLLRIDGEALLSVAAYIDRNLVAAGIAATPEQNPHTSVKAPVDNAVAQDRVADLQAAQQGSVAGSRAASQLEDSLWLIPIEDRRQLDSSREGMLAGFTLGNYLLLVEHTGRLLREGKASISPELVGIFDRLGSTAEAWQARMQRLGGGRLLGRFLASSRSALRSAASKLGVHHLANLCGCSA